MNHLHKKNKNAPTLTRVQLASNAIDTVERVLKEVGLWSTDPASQEMMAFEKAFGGDTMGFHQWVQFVLIPRVKAYELDAGQLPQKSNVAERAFREYVTYHSIPQYAPVAEALQAFDDIINFHPKVDAFRTYATLRDPVCDNERDFTAAFAQESTSFVGWQVELTHRRVGKPLEVTFDAVYVDVKGALLGTQQLVRTVDPNWDNSFQFGCWGWDETGHWPKGTYQILLHMWNEPLATTNFLITPQEDMINVQISDIQKELENDYMYAGCSSGPGEGIARMHTVRRTQIKLADAYMREGSTDNLQKAKELIVEVLANREGVKHQGHMKILCDLLGQLGEPTSPTLLTIAKKQIERHQFFADQNHQSPDFDSTVSLLQFILADLPEKKSLLDQMESLRVKR